MLRYGFYRWCTSSFPLHTGIEAGIKMFRKEFAMWREHHVAVSCRHFKNRQPAAGERSPMCSLPFGIACATEYRDVTRIGLGHVVAACPNTKSIVVSGSVFVRDGTPLANPLIIPPKQYLPPYLPPYKSQPPPYKYQSTKE